MSYIKEVDIFIAIDTLGTVYPTTGAPISMLLSKEVSEKMGFSFAMMYEKFDSITMYSWVVLQALCRWYQKRLAIENVKVNV